MNEKNYSVQLKFDPQREPVWVGRSGDVVVRPIRMTESEAVGLALLCGGEAVKLDSTQQERRQNEEHRGS